MPEVALQRAEGRAVRSENRLFAYHLLAASHDAAEEYMFLSGGRHVHDSGIELFISGQVARRLVATRPRVTVPWGATGANLSKKRRERSFLVDHVVLEAGRPLIFENVDHRQRLDLALITTQAQEPGSPRRDRHEAFLGVEVKRYLSDVAKDIEKLRDILLLHESNDWCLTAGGSVSFSSDWKEQSKRPADLLGDRLKSYEAGWPDVALEACWMERPNPMQADAGEVERDAGDDPQAFRSLAAYCIFVTLR